MTRENQMEVQEAVIRDFFELTTVSQLAQFCDSIDPSDALSVALQDRVVMWLQRYSGDLDVAFDPNQFLSSDLSAAQYGICPTIFMGSNQWALKRNLLPMELAQKVEYFCHGVNVLSQNNSNRFCFVVVPEKDVVMDKLAGRVGRVAGLDMALSQLSDACSSLRVPFVYDDFVKKLPSWASEDEYRYPDSHLLSRDYFLIFSEILLKFGLNSVRLLEGTRFELRNFYGDLNDKFGSPLYSQQEYIFPQMPGDDAILAGGSATFESPLGSTVQKFHNETAPIKRKVAIYGDSHSSISVQKRLTYMSSQIFEHCEFYWIPWGGSPEDFQSDADFVVMEIAQRFVFT